MVSFDLRRGLLVAGCLIASCRSDHGGSPSVDDAGRDSSTKADAAAGDDRNDVVLTTLSLVEAPAPTQRFFWGTLDVTEPGFAVGPRDDLTIALDADNHLRYMSWKTLGSIPKTFGDGPKDFPQSGMKHLDLHPDLGVVCDATVEESSSSASHFLLRMHVVSTDVLVDGSVAHLTDFVESTEGTLSGAGWSIVYDSQGTLFGALNGAHGAGTVYTGDPNAVSPPAGHPSLWSAPVELTAPHFYGPPVDHLTVALDARGQLRSFSFEKFNRQNMKFGTGLNEFPLSGSASLPGDSSLNAVTVVVNDAVAPTASHFVIRYHVTGDQSLSDYVEGLDGTHSADGLVVRYFIKGQRTQCP